MTKTSSPVIVGRRRYPCPKCRRRFIWFDYDKHTLTYQRQRMCRKCARKANLDLGQKKLKPVEKKEEQAK